MYLEENRKIKKKIKNATNNIENNKKWKVIEYLNIWLYFLQRHPQQLILNKWTVKSFTR